MEKSIPRYTEEFKCSLVSLYQNGKSQTQLYTEFGFSQSVLANGSNDFRSVNNSTLTLKQFQEQQKRIARLEEKKLILKKL